MVKGLGLTLNEMNYFGPSGDRRGTDQPHGSARFVRLFPTPKSLRKNLIVFRVRALQFHLSTFVLNTLYKLFAAGLNNELPCRPFDGSSHQTCST